MEEGERERLAEKVERGFRLERLQERAKGILSTPRGGVLREGEVWWEEGILQIGCSEANNNLERWRLKA